VGPRRAALGLTLCGALWSAAPAHAAIAVIASASASSTTATLTLTKPTNTASGQVMVATVSGAGTTTISAPAGWTLVQDTTSGALRQLLYVKVAAAGEPTSYAFASSGSRNASGGITTYSGVNATVPVDASDEALGASGNAAAPSVTTSAANDLVITAVAIASATTVTPASGTTERYDKASASTDVEVADATAATAGATTARTAVPAITTTAWTAQTVALRDASAAGLSLATDAAAAFSASLDAGDQTPSFTFGTTVTDTRTGASAGLGWNLTITSTQYTTGSATLSTTASTVTGAAATCSNGGVCVAPVNATAYPVTVPAAATAPAAVKLASVAAGGGEGLFSMPVTIAVRVPQNSFSGSYHSTITVSIVSGP
jgi:hypothetical protein